MMEYHQLCNYELLEQAFARVKQNAGAPGVDSQTIANFEEELALGLNSILYDLNQQHYAPQPLKRSQLRLPNKKPRWLAFPTVRDRIVHTAIAILLQPYFEEEFEHNSYGYRPGRSYMMAVDKIISHRNQGLQYVFDADITGYFDHIPQPKLIEKMQQTAIDPTLIELIINLLFSHQHTDGQLIFGKAAGLGIPQGSAISPLLANYYLDELDEQLIKLNYQMVRYADDFVVCCATQKAAQHAQYHTEQVLHHLGLTLNLNKTQLTTFSEGFRFLGHYFIGEQVIDEKSNLQYGVMEKTMDFAASASEQLQEQLIAQLDTPAKPYNQTIEEDADWLDVPENLLSQPSLVKRKPLKTLYLTQVGAVVGIRGNRAYLSIEGEVVKTWPLSVIDAVIVMGRVQLTTDFLGYCTEHSITLILASSTGRYKGELSTYPNCNAALYSQITKLGADSFHRELSTVILDAKFYHSCKVLEQQTRRSTLTQACKMQLHEIAKSLNKGVNQLRNAKTRQQQFTLEAQMAKQYFQGLALALPEEWGFTGRNRLPPKDPINALLSLGYNLLFNNLLCMVRKHGLHPDIGMLHCGDYQPSLVLDLMEPFRALVVDTTVIKMINKQQFQHDDFEVRGEQCLLTSAGLKKFITEIENKLTASFSCKRTKQLKDYRKAMNDQVLSFKMHLQSGTKFTAFKAE
ncbi:CRISPR-associated endonuclease Cas1 [Pseudoalteromonas maricaloris]